MLSSSEFLRMRSTHILVLALLAVLPAAPQTANQWDFLSDPSRFPDIHGTLRAYLRERASSLLDERAREVSRISSRSDLAARQRYVRERMWNYLGGQPERTPLNPKMVGMLDRGDYRIEKILFESRPKFYVTAN